MHHEMFACFWIWRANKYQIRVSSASQNWPFNLLIGAPFLNRKYTHERTIPSGLKPNPRMLRWESETGASIHCCMDSWGPVFKWFLCERLRLSYHFLVLGPRATRMSFTLHVPIVSAHYWRLSSVCWILCEARKKKLHLQSQLIMAGTRNWGNFHKIKIALQYLLNIKQDEWYLK